MSKKQKMIMKRMITIIMIICISVAEMPMEVFSYNIIKNDNRNKDEVEKQINENELKEENVPEIIGYEYAKKKNHIKRVYDKENSLNEIVFLNDDGTETAYLYDYPVKYEDDEGNVKDISLKIKKDENGKGYKTADNSIVTTFSEKINDGIILESNTEKISLIPHLPNDETNRDTNETISSINAIDDRTVSYVYDEDTVIEYSLTYTGFKEDIVVNEYTGQTEYDFTILTNGLKLVEIDNSYYLVDEEGTIKSVIGDIIIFTADEKNNAMGELCAQTIVENEEYLLTIVLDAEYLADEDTVYPIKIDPTVEICYDNNGAGAISDVTINSKSTTSPSSGSLFVGSRETYGISRILMKFPGLNLSSLGSNIRITNATVEIRDLMCESTALYVGCYVFAGNAWNESTVHWSNVSPNSVSTYLSSNTISYSNGIKQATAHRYKFDITKAVEGWRAGNYNPNKGIIFKTSATVEGGTNYNSKTFASYNRSSYKPSLSVTYAHISSYINNGTYYLNNKYCGDYLRYNSSVGATSGLIANLGNSIQWEICKIASGYVIRSKKDSTQYLAVSSTKSSSEVTVVKVSDSVIPTRCVWSITSGSGGCLIKSVYNSKYLYTYGTTVYTTSSLGTVGTAAYNTRVWRVVNTSTYGASSSYSYREVTANSYFSFIGTTIGTSKTVKFNAKNSNEYWTDASEFTYSGYSSIIKINSLTGVITPISEGKTTVTAVHKVTNRSYKFDVYVSSLVIYQTKETKYCDAAGNYAEDLNCGDKTKEELTDLGWVNWSDFYNKTTDDYYEGMKSIAKLTSSKDTSMRDVAYDMIDHFFDGSGSIYQNSVLSKKVYEHESTQEYIEYVKQYVDELISEYDGNISELVYKVSTRKNVPLVKKLKDNNIYQPEYSNTLDYLNGMVFCLHGLWGNQIEIISYENVNGSYNCALQFTLYDHFGLDQEDVETYGYIGGFRYWYVLQHYDGFNKAYKPFLTNISFVISISGDI